jgi:hypothetical protein
MKKVSLLCFVLWLVLIGIAHAQDAVPFEILSRTFMIKVGNEVGTAFKVDYQGKVFLVTARHLAAGLPETAATFQFFQSGGWQDFHTLKTLFPHSNDVDIAVFETNEKLAQPYVIECTGTSGATMGQQVFFLGFPYGISSHFAHGEMVPFIKRGTMSAFDATNRDAIVLYIDGFNNPGFSGGPIIYWSFEKHTYGILGVVKGFREDSAKVVVNGQHVDTNVLVNSGILVGYSIDHAIQAIVQSEQKHP